MTDWGRYSPWPERTQPIPVEGGIRARSRKGAIGETWWSRRWVAVLESFGYGNRLARGRVYARRGQVLAIDVHPGQAKARVQGFRVTPYRVEIRLPVLTDPQWEAATRQMASRAVFAAQLLAGEMPEDIEEAFETAGLSLFPKSSRELVTSCSCPDWANPCKHVAAVYYLLAEEFDRDPFLLFTLRGRTKEQLLEALRALRAGAPEKAMQTSSDTAGSSDTTGSPATDGVPAANGGPAAGAMPEAEDPLFDALLRPLASPAAQSAPSELPRLARMPAPPAVDAAILRQLGPSGITLSGRDLVEVLEPVYPLVTRYVMRLSSCE
ncbi:SWIM zinc finger family protein [Carboxydochorda subterranea]|uniref:SWIM zinc finger family protein n=1 Tax=Carboxydichorda subterranea TaxID=3109565 RepID=A0ABZ1C1X5_9FIRM|nr:SWIM zinc finger family protein [Limnochorda sp. L945t]WRP18796.1 SWIM zinc finger family protein [Limnochorda sp. L945t]